MNQGWRGWRLTDNCSRVAAKVGGFKTVEDYKIASSPLPVLNQIKKPFFFLSALDDPFFGPDVIPIGHCSDQILIGITKTGGHVSHLEGRFLPAELWWPKPIFDFFDYFHSQIQPIEVAKIKKSDSATKLTELVSPKSSSNNSVVLN